MQNTRAKYSEISLQIELSCSKESNYEYWVKWIWTRVWGMSEGVADTITFLHETRGGYTIPQLVEQAELPLLSYYVYNFLNFKREMQQF
jgi:hypothetical protein